MHSLYDIEKTFELKMKKKRCMREVKKGKRKCGYIEKGEKLWRAKNDRVEHSFSLHISKPSAAVVQRATRR